MSNVVVIDLHATASKERLCSGWTRRALLQVGTLGPLGLSLPSAIAAEAGSGKRNSERSCILIWLTGGASHLDTFDPKPDAPAEVRGEFGTLTTPVPGIRLSDRLPRLAALAREYALLRSVYHDQPDHVAAHQHVLCGRSNLEAPYPNMGAVIARLAPSSGRMHPYVTLPRLLTLTTFGTSQLGQDGGAMGRDFDPLVPESVPPVVATGVEALRQGEITYRIRDLTPPTGFDPGRFDRRRGLLAVADHEALVQLGSGPASARAAYERAFDLITSAHVRRAFDLSSESPALRDRYGRNYVGVGSLLARRLVEAGSRFVTINFQGFTSGWDTHEDNFRAIRDRLAPTLDAALSTLLQDLRDRGLLERTLVLCMGEFGRTPKIDPNAGRGHWPNCYSVLAAGGGVRGGQVIGSSDSYGGEPADRPIPSHDVVASVFDRFGLSPDDTYTMRDGRPQPLAPGARPIRELF